MKIEAITNFVNTYSAVLVTMLFGVIYYVAKKFIFGSWSFTGLELFTLFLFYEFTSLKKLLKEHFRNVEWGILYNKIQMDKVHGTPTAEDILRGMMRHND